MLRPYWSHGWSDEAGKIEHRMLAVLKNVSIYDNNVCNVIYNIVQLLFSAKHCDAVPNLVHCAINLCKNINDGDVKKSTAKWGMTELYLILRQAEFYNGNRNPSISSLRLALTYFEVRTRVIRNACKFLRFRAYFENTCLHHAWQEARNATYSIYLLIIADTFDAEYFPHRTIHLTIIIVFTPFFKIFCLNQILY